MYNMIFIDNTHKQTCGFTKQYHYNIIPDLK